MRSKLFVPGSRPELFTKAFASEADAVSIDLEDAVLETRKAEARAGVADWLRQQGAQPQRKRLIVRVNAMDTPHFEADIAAVVQPGLHVINLPKPQSPDAVRAAVDLIARLERSQGLNSPAHPPIQLLLNIETPQGLRQAAALAAADPRVMGLQVGLGDLFEPLGIDRQEQSAVQQVLLAVRLAAGEAGVDAYDGAYANVANPEGYLAEAKLARCVGFAGNSALHPRPIALGNRALRLTDEEIAHSVRVTQSALGAEQRGAGAYVVDGRMIDAPFLKRARNIVAAAKQLGLLVD